MLERNEILKIYLTSLLNNVKRHRQIALFAAFNSIHSSLITLLIDEIHTKITYFTNINLTNLKHNKV
jgi:hypothetical protein